MSWRDEGGEYWSMYEGNEEENEVYAVDWLNTNGGKLKVFLRGRNANEWGEKGKKGIACDVSRKGRSLLFFFFKSM